VDGEGGSAPGIWTRPDQANLQALGTWPKPIVDKYLWSWGNNAAGQLGLINTTNYSSPKQVGALNTWKSCTGGSDFSAATKTNGTLWSFGGNSFGQLGIGSTSDQISPNQVGALTNWLKIAAVYRRCMATKTDGTL
jgi:alpha-tubulin suppressor-like RCC1 family protein